MKKNNSYFAITKKRDDGPECDISIYATRSEADDSVWVMPHNEGFISRREFEPLDDDKRFLVIQTDWRPHEGNSPTHYLDIPSIVRAGGEWWAADEFELPVTRQRALEYVAQQNVDIAEEFFSENDGVKDWHVVVELGKGSAALIVTDGIENDIGIMEVTSKKSPFRVIYPTSEEVELLGKTAEFQKLFAEQLATVE